MELSIRNFAIIDELTVSFTDGLTVLTGETGAGKSIIIDAIHLLTGGRGSVDYIRHGSEKAEITGQFALQNDIEQIATKSAEYGIELEEQVLILERVITNSGKSICRINGKLVTLAVLREIGQLLVHIHSQHDTMHLIDRSTHLALLDRYNAKKIIPLTAKYAKHYTKLSSLRRKLEALSTDEQQIAHRLDLLKFQRTELEDAHLQLEEDEILEEERKQLQNFEKLFRSLNEAYDALHGDQKGLEWVHDALNALKNGAEHDPFIEKHREIITNIYYQLEDSASEIVNYMGTLHFDEERLNEIEHRLNELNRLKKKYGNTVEEMINYLQKINCEINELEDRDNHMDQLIQQIGDTEKEAISVAKQLQAIRKKTATKLEIEIKDELNELYLENARFHIQFEQTELHENGIDQITFMLATNLGEPLKELSKVASGGELSRIMLALKKIFAEIDHAQTVIFDEIDTGVSGRVAQRIAEKMYEISTTAQTLCITHLPQVAAMADQHYAIKKIEHELRTSTEIHALTNEEINQEIGKMITGDKLTDTAIEHAQQLLHLTNTFKKNIQQIS